ncbi:unnamed protein product [Larinioides sclopetarius]|uniref:Uncharacterized protein n=1 Tax=Larinioides sclopetarius TaxID=280406 RepID=A0AAV2BFG1_9ARAC
MKSGYDFAFMCLILMCVLHLSSSKCPIHEVKVLCRNDCNTCEQQGFCYNCSTVACDCVMEFVRNSKGVCTYRDNCPNGWKQSRSRGCPDNFQCNEDCKRDRYDKGYCLRRVWYFLFIFPIHRPETCYCWRERRRRYG